MQQEQKADLSFDDVFDAVEYEFWLDVVDKKDENLADTPPTPVVDMNNVSLEITAAGMAYLHSENAVPVCLGELGHERESGHRKLEPTDDFWLHWNQNKDIIRDRFGFTVRKVKGAWDVQFYSVAAPKIGEKKQCLI